MGFVAGWLIGIFSHPNEAARISSADFDGNDRRGSPNAKPMLVLHFTGQSWLTPAHEIDSRQSRAWLGDEGPFDAFLKLSAHWSQIR